MPTTKEKTSAPARDRLFTCMYNRVPDPLFEKYKIERVGDDSLDPNNIAEVYVQFCETLSDLQFDPEKDTILLFGHFKLVSCLMLAVKEFIGEESFAIIHYDPRTQEYSNHWITPVLEPAEEDKREVKL